MSVSYTSSVDKDEFIYYTNSEQRRAGMVRVCKNQKESVLAMVRKGKLDAAGVGLRGSLCGIQLWYLYAGGNHASVCRM